MGEPLNQAADWLTSKWRPPWGQQSFINHSRVHHGRTLTSRSRKADMDGNSTIAENDIGHIDPVEKKVLDLIQRFNDPDQEHVLRGIFQDTDALNEISAKQRQAATTMSCALAELVALRTAVEFLKAQWRL